MIMLNVAKQGWWNKNHNGRERSDREQLHSDSVLRRVKYFGLLAWEIFRIEHDYIETAMPISQTFEEWNNAVLPILQHRMRVRAKPKQSTK